MSMLRTLLTRCRPAGVMPAAHRGGAKMTRLAVGAGGVVVGGLALTLPAARCNGNLYSSLEKVSSRMEALEKAVEKLSMEGTPLGEAAVETGIEEARRDGRTGLRPMVEPFNSGMLQVSDIHSIYFEECGNPNGKPVVIVHGGPGGGCSGSYRCFHDPEVYRIVLFDQRGCSRSVPHANLEDNTTWHLIDDMEKLREHLGIARWQVFGGSWGSTLSLSYAIKHPTAVTELVLRGIFMLRQSELNWYYQDGASHIYPDRWEEYRDAIPEAERGDFMQAYRRRLVGVLGPEEQIKAARAWTRWENTTSNLYGPKGEVAGDEDKFALAFARIENHYFVNHGFFEWESWILDNIDRIRHIPAVIVQGRYDVVCPAKSAWDLHRAWPEAKFTMVQDSGHSAMEPGTLSLLMNATEVFKAGTH